MKDIICLAIESSCDETACAIIKNGREVLANVINSQIDIHKKFGGVVPEIASRHHIENINIVIEEALEVANITFDDVDFVASTYGPGLVGALLVGLSAAKGLAFALNKPFVGVNHLHGHIAANYIEHKELEPPFICMLLSGGHTHLINVQDYDKFEIIGKTKDDAIGEAFDKVARTLNLAYPGGPVIDKLAKEGQDICHFKRTTLDEYNFSFSGLKTAVINYVAKNKEYKVEDICKSFEQAAIDVVVQNTRKAVKEFKVDKVAIAGGVAANSLLREEMNKMCEEENIKLYSPRISLCTDNAAMIGAAAYYKFVKGNYSNLDLNAYASLGIKD